MAAASKTRQPRLRASCDGCFLAKVKCSKARPLCSRCLACGLDCRYSPSSRAGKPKVDHSNANRQSFAQIQNQEDASACLNYTAVSQLPTEHIFQANNGWMTPPSSVDGTMTRNPSLSSNLSHFGTETTLIGDGDLMAVDAFAASMPWTPPNDLSYQIADIPISTSPMATNHVRALSLDSSMAPWTDTIPTDTMGFANPLAGASLPTYSSSPAPSLSRSLPGRKSSSAVNNSSCTCFTTCLQSLQALHNASSISIPPFDHILSLNGKAVEGCAAMLNCSKCMSHSGTQTSTMLLATIIDKIVSFYKSASSTYFDGAASSVDQASGNHGVSYGVYQLNGEDGKWFELEILSRELRKLDEVYSKFREVCSDSTNDLEINKVMIGYLGQSLGSTVEVVNNRKGDRLSAFVC